VLQHRSGRGLGFRNQPDGSWSVELSADDRFAYVTGTAGVAILARETTTGRLLPLAGPAA
jgi:hypothetical protein